MAGRAAASPPAGAGPPPSPCPAVCGLRSSSSPCLRGPDPGEPRAGRRRRRRGGPRCRCWPPPAGRAALAPLPAPSAPQHLPGAGGAARAGGCSRGGGAEPSARHSWIPHSNFKSRLLLPPPPMGARPRPLRASPLAAAGVRTAGTAGPAGAVPRRGWTGRTRRALHGRGSGPGPPDPGGCRGGEGGVGAHTGPAAPSAGGGGGGGALRCVRQRQSPVGPTAAPGEGEAGERRGEMGQGETAPARPLLRGRPAGAKVPRAARGRCREPGARQLQPPVARGSAPSQVPRLRSSLLRRRAQPEIPAPLQGPGRLPPATSPPLPGAGSAAGLGACGSLSCAPRNPRSSRGAAPPGAGRPWAGRRHHRGQRLPGEPVPQRGWGDGPATPNRGSSGSPPIPPARRTRPELPLPVRLRAAAGAGPDGEDHAASIPRGGGGTPGEPRRKPEPFYQGRGQSKGFSADTAHFECGHPCRLSQGPVS